MFKFIDLINLYFLDYRIHANEYITSEETTTIFSVNFFYHVVVRYQVLNVVSVVLILMFC